MNKLWHKDGMKLVDLSKKVVVLALHINHNIIMMKIQKLVVFNQPVTIVLLTVAIGAN